MASFFITCTGCGLYMRNEKGEILKLLKTHACDSKKKLKERFREIKAIVDTIFTGMFIQIPNAYSFLDSLYWT